MKRNEPQLEEAQILMRALRDFNTPKIPNHDTPVFLRLIDDLFMGLTVTSKQDPELVKKIIRSTREMKLQNTDMFQLKTCQVRWVGVGLGVGVGVGVG